jgi:hypothetical protein
MKIAVKPEVLLPTIEYQELSSFILDFMPEAVSTTAVLLSYRKCF